MHSIFLVRAFRVPEGVLLWFATLETPGISYATAQKCDRRYQSEGATLDLARACR